MKSIFIILLLSFILLSCSRNEIDESQNNIYDIVNKVLKYQKAFNKQGFIDNDQLDTMYFKSYVLYNKPYNKINLIKEKGDLVITFDNQFNISDYFKSFFNLSDSSCFKQQLTKHTIEYWDTTKLNTIGIFTFNEKKSNLASLVLFSNKNDKDFLFLSEPIFGCENKSAIICARYINKNYLIDQKLLLKKINSKWEITKYSRSICKFKWEGKNVYVIYLGVL